ncbi:unnamed protein product [Brassica napus]|uniref:(rape) hypothetical protein n=1 Tax=Brassica napus TaxID=3708 RepID=A0A817AP92_BRANA|nr:unnamed protein product [Brassica napus]
MFSLTWLIKTLPIYAPGLVAAYIGKVSNVISEFLVSVRRLVLNVSTSMKYRINPDYHVLGWEWNKPKSVPECLLSHLETFVWRRYDWKGEKEEEVAIYLLKNARGLKNATFSTGPIEPGQLDKLKQRRRTRKKLDGVLKASNTCHLVFKFE